jgi:hypothetical protein
MAPFPLLLALLAQAVTAQPTAPDWREIGLSVNGRQAAYDRASIARAGPVTRVRMRFTEAASYAVSMVELRCAAYEARIMGMITYDANGVEQSRNEMVTPFRAIIAGTFLETLRGEVCGTGQGSAAQ